jgi:hypothetical protein
MLLGLIFLVALYLTFDVADPMMPGALTFSVEDSVEARTAPRLRADDVATLSASAPEWLQLIVELPVRSDSRGAGRGATFIVALPLVGGKVADTGS